MADITTPVAQRAATPVPTSDAVHLHAHACNALNRCLRELHAEHTDHEALARHMYQAKDAIEELRVLAGFNLWH